MAFTSARRDPENYLTVTVVLKEKCRLEADVLTRCTAENTKVES